MSTTMSFDMAQDTGPYWSQLCSDSSISIHHIVDTYPMNSISDSHTTPT